MRKVLALVGMLSLAGCETITIAMTEKIQPQPLGSDVGLLQIIENPRDQNPLWGNGGKDISGFCVGGDVHQLTEAIWVPIAVNLAIKAAGKATGKYVKGIKDKSSNSTKFRAFVDSEKLANAGCLVAYRGPELLMKGQTAQEVKQPSAVVVMKVEHLGQAIRLVPIYASAKNSISMTKCASDCDKELPNGKINIAVAVTATAAVGNALREVNLRDLGTASVTVKQLPLRGKLIDKDSNDKITGKPIGAPSDIIAVPEPGVGVQLAVVMSEIGDVAGDPDVAEAEIQAAVESLSVGAEAELKAHYEREAAD